MAASDDIREIMDLLENEEPYQEPSFTLDQLAWFNRCMFPGDFAEEIAPYLVKVGYVDNLKDAKMHGQMISRYEAFKKGVVGLYQECIGNEKFCMALNMMVADFLKK